MVLFTASKLVVRMSVGRAKSGEVWRPTRTLSAVLRILSTPTFIPLKKIAAAETHIV